MKRAFTLIEILIVVAILGILAAIVLPTFKGHITEAREAAARDNLRILRNAIELYAAQHNGVPPGYFMGYAGSPLFEFFWYQLVWATNAAGGYSPIEGTPGFPLGPYIPTIPSNPFNNLNTVSVLLNDDEFPAEATGEYGWVYQPWTKTIKLDWTGTDENGVAYFDY